MVKSLERLYDHTKRKILKLVTNLTLYLNVVKLLIYYYITINEIKIFNTP